MLRILHKSKSLVIIYKPQGIPTQSDTSGDADAMSLTSDMLREASEPHALWLVQRLDRVVGGLIVFARNKETAAELSALVGGNGMEKEYYAVVEGECEGGELRDYIYKDSAKGKAFIVDTERKGAKAASLEYTPLVKVETEKGIRTLVKIKLHTGRFHQIRVQFSSRGLPLVGDGKYGSHDNTAKTPALLAARLAFKTKKEKIDIKKLPDIDVYPWSLFDEEFYK